MALKGAVDKNSIISHFRAHLEEYSLKYEVGHQLTSSPSITNTLPTALPRNRNLDTMTKLVQKLGTQRTADMIDVLISCSRKDIEFTQRLHHGLEAQDHEPVNLYRGPDLGIPQFFSEGKRSNQGYRKCR